MFSLSEARESIYTFVSLLFAHNGAQRRKNEESWLKAAVWKVWKSQQMNKTQRPGFGSAARGRESQCEPK